MYMIFKVFQKEVKRVEVKKDSAANVDVFVPQTGRQVAGRDYAHQEFCQSCWDGGELIVCSVCPAAYHATCLRLKKAPSTFQWICPLYELYNTTAMMMAIDLMLHFLAGIHAMSVSGEPQQRYPYYPHVGMR